MSDLSNIVNKATDAIVNGQALSTDNLNDLAKIFYASANRIIEAIDKSAGLHREIVQQLPTEDIDDSTIYMVLDSSASGSDIYDEWMWIENAWEHIGSTRVDLSDYYTKGEVDTALSGKASTSDIPTTLASLSEDTTHRVVTDTEKTTWNGKANPSTSLAGYGITDAYTKTEVDTALGNCIVAQNNAGFHNSIYRGKSLGSSVTAAQQTAIHNGTFEDLFIGDYWTINSVKYRIAAFDYWLNAGSDKCTSHHVVLVPDNMLYKAKMYDSLSTSGGYYGSAMRGSVGNVAAGNLTQARTTIQSAFGASSLLVHKEYITRNSEGGYPSFGAWYNSDIELMNEPMVFGSYVYAPGSTGTITPYRFTASKTQLPLFRLDPSAISFESTSTNTNALWLRDIVKEGYFACIASTSTPDYDGSNNSFGVRPCFAITY